MQLRLAHRALQPQQQPVVEVLRRVDPVGVGDQRAGQRAQIKQLMPVRGAASEPRHLKRQHQPNLAEADLRHELLEPEPAVRRGARPAEVLVDDRDRRGRPPQLDRALAQRVLTRPRLMVALQLRRRRLAHVHDRAPTPMRVGDLRTVTHRARPPSAAPADTPTGASTPPAAPAAASPTPPPPPAPPRPVPTPAGPTSSPPFSPEARPRPGRDARRAPGRQAARSGIVTVAASAVAGSCIGPSTTNSHEADSYAGPCGLRSHVGLFRDGLGCGDAAAALTRRSTRTERFATASASTTVRWGECAPGRYWVVNASGCFERNLIRDVGYPDTRDPEIESVLCARNPWAKAVVWREVRRKRVSRTPKEMECRDLLKAMLCERWRIVGPPASALTGDCHAGIRGSRGLQRPRPPDHGPIKPAKRGAESDATRPTVKAARQGRAGVLGMTLRSEVWVLDWGPDRPARGVSPSPGKVACWLTLRVCSASDPTGTY